MIKKQNAVIIDSLGDCFLMATQILAPYNFTITTASTVEDGKKLLAHYKPELIITDCLVAPIPLVWIDEARHLGINSQVIAVTQEENSTRSLDWLAGGVHSLLKRPLSPDCFLSLILRAMNSLPSSPKIKGHLAEEQGLGEKKQEATLAEFYKSLIGHLNLDDLNREIVKPIKKLTGASQVHLQVDGISPVNTRENTWEVHGLHKDCHHYGDLWLHFDSFAGAKDNLKLMKDMTEAIAAALAVICNYQKAVEMGAKDSLTGLYNRRIGNESLVREFSKACRHNLNLSLIMVDLDHFKSVNDTYGHQIGDLVLQEVARFLGQVTREADLVALLGGEEFIMLLPHTTQKQALEVAQRLRTITREHLFNFDGITFNQTLSQGIVDREHLLVNKPSDMIYWADQALYLAKREGRDTIRTATDIPIVQATNDSLHMYQ